MAGKKWYLSEKETLVEFCVHHSIIDDEKKVKVSNIQRDDLNKNFGLNYSEKGWKTLISRFIREHKSFVEKSIEELNDIIEASYPKQSVKCKHCGVKFEEKYIHILNDVPICERCLSDGIKKQSELFQRNEELVKRVAELEKDNAYLRGDKSKYIIQVDEQKKKVSFLEKLLGYTEDQLEATKQIQEALEQTVSLFSVEREGW